MRRRVLEIVGSLAREGDARAMSLVAAGLDPAEFGITHHMAAEPRTFDVSSWWRLRNVIGGLRADIVHVWPSVSPAVRLAALTATAGRVVVGRLAPNLSGSWHESTTDRVAAARAAALVVDCSAVAHLWRDRGWPEEKIHVIPPGAPHVEPVNQSRQELLSELRLPERSRLIAAAGPLELAERLKDLIWATDLLKVIRDDVHLLVIGDGPHRERLERYVRLCLIRDKIHFLRGRVELARILPHVDVFWRGGGRPGLPLSVVQAMAAGVPVVAADVPGMSELVVHEQTGYLVPVGDRAGLARFANKIIDDAELAQRLGSAAKQRIATQFAAQAMVERYAALYREVSG
jgi:glycosyltransferase involved in cell wall biosynthesis